MIEIINSDYIDYANTIESGSVILTHLDPPDTDGVDNNLLGKHQIQTKIDINKVKKKRTKTRIITNELEINFNNAMIEIESEYNLSNELLKKSAESFAATLAYDISNMPLSKCMECSEFNNFKCKARNNAKVNKLTKCLTFNKLQYGVEI